MRRRRVLAVLVPLFGVAALVLWFPARWALALTGNRLQPLALQGVHGSVWSGSATRLSWAGRSLGRVQWSLSRQALIGRVHGRVQLRAPIASVRARFTRVDADTFQLRDVHARAQLAALPLLADGLKPGGMLDADFDRVRVRAGWPVALHGTVRWHDARLARPDDKTYAARLGTLYARLDDQAGTRLTATLGDAGDGSVSLHGTAELTPLGWRLDAVLAPRTGALSPLLRRFGPIDASGRLQLHRRGGLLKGVHP